MAAPFAFNDQVYNAIYPGWGRAEAQADWNAVGTQKYNDYLARQKAPASTSTSTTSSSSSGTSNSGTSQSFTVPAEFGGKTLRQLRDEGRSFRPDIVADWFGISEDTPLTAGKVMSATIPGQYVGSSSEWNVLTGLFGSPTQPGTTTTTPPPAVKVPTAEEYAAALIDAEKKQFDEETKFLEQYTKDNPFVFDEELARKSSTAEYEPYYSELLKDYVGNLELQRQTTRGDAALLTTLNKLDMGTRTLNYQNAVKNAEEGYAGRGMFFSGAKNRAVGQEEISYKTGVEGAQARYETGQAGYQRQLGAYDIAEEQKRRDIFGGDVALGGLAKYAGREGEYHGALESGILQRQKEAQAQYYVPLEQTYQRKYGTPGEALKGYTVPEYYRV